MGQQDMHLENFWCLRQIHTQFPVSRGARFCVSQAKAGSYLAGAHVDAKCDLGWVKQGGISLQEPGKQMPQGSFLL